MNQTFFYIALVLLCACSVSHEEPERYSYPNWIAPLSKNQNKKIILASLNSLLSQTNASEEEYQYQDGEVTSIQVGGDAIKSYLKILRERFPSGLVLLASGDHVGQQPTLDQIKSTFSFLEDLNFDAISLDTKSFIALNSPGAKIEDLEKSKLPFTVSNFLNLKEQGPYQVANSSSLRVVEKNGIKIAVVSINHLNEDEKNLLVKKYQVLIQDPVMSILKLKGTRSFRTSNFKVALVNIPSLCKGDVRNITKSYSARDSHQLDCPEGDPLLSFINRLPPNTIDLVIANNTSFAEGYIGDIAVIQNPGNGQFLGWMEIPFNPETKEIRREQIKILPAIKFCHQFLLSRKDCHLIGDTEKIDDHPQGKEVIGAKFLGHEI